MIDMDKYINLFIEGWVEGDKKILGIKLSIDFTPMAKTESILSTPIKLILGFLRAFSIIKLHFPGPISK